ncbi:MAG: Na/Pi symporter [Flavobacteriales bacterium]|nr:Na/Pi symporter [Flavobacteriales bacterium]
MEGFNIWQLLGGVTAFLFAMSLISGSLRALSGRSFKKFLQKQTSTSLRGLLSGTLVTAVMQSSSVVVLMVLSFVGAGIIPLRNALAVVLGSNLGTTTNSWIVAVAGFKTNLQSLAFPLLGLALSRFVLFPKNEMAKSIADFLIGIALLFIGLNWMQEGNRGLADFFRAEDFLDHSHYWFILIGFVITVLLQSSGATFALTLASVHEGVLPLLPAAGMVLGAELGTTIKILIGSIGGTPDQKRMAVANFGWNFITAAIVAVLLRPFLFLVTDVFRMQDPYMSLALFQSMVNLLAIVLFFPFVKQAALLTKKIFRVSEGEIDLQFIRNRETGKAENKLQLAELEIMRLLRLVMEYNLNLISNKQEHGEKGLWGWWNRLFRPVSRTEQYKRLKELHGEILDYLVELNEGEMTPEENERCVMLINASRYIIVGAKDVKDVEHNLTELRSTVQDEQYAMMERFELFESDFFNHLKELFISEAGAVVAEKLSNWQHHNKSWQLTQNQYVYNLLDHDKLDHKDASTLLNVIRSLYSSHKSILKALDVMFHRNGGHNA